MASDKKFDASTPDSVWQVKLSKEQFRVLREKHTERAGTGQYNKTKDAGVYRCAGCDTPLFTSTQKFDSGCGWVCACYFIKIFSRVLITLISLSSV